MLGHLDTREQDDITVGLCSVGPAHPHEDTIHLHTPNLSSLGQSHYCHGLSSLPLRLLAWNKNDKPIFPNPLCHFLHLQAGETLTCVPTSTPGYVWT